jgi:hypothetical protein
MFNGIDATYKAKSGTSEDRLELIIAVLFLEEE